MTTTLTGSADDDMLVTSCDAARAASRTPDTIRQWRRDGRLTPAVTTPSGFNLFRLGDVRRVAEERRSRRE
jgi:hypothetical protein